MFRSKTVSGLFLVGYLLGAAPLLPAADRPQWGQRHTRNMVSEETNLPASFDPAAAKNIKWVIPLGSSTYSTPVIAGGKVFIGTNNDHPRDPRHKGDRGVLLCLNETDGSLAWQLLVPKLEGDVYLDWPKAGICSPPTVEGDRVYVVTNRAEVLCLDMHGLHNGNDGPYQDEARHMTPVKSEPLELTELDADILWVFDMRSGAGMYPHDSAHSSILLDGDFLYLNTGNGVDNTHRCIRAPDAPSLIVLDKNTGRLLARDNERIGPRIYHAAWSSPALGEVQGCKMVFFGGADGVCYAFAALDNTSQPDQVQNLQRLWRFDCDPNAPKENVHQYLDNRRESPSTISAMPVFHQGRVYVVAGGDIWWGKPQSWLKCIDAAPTADITQTAAIWSYEIPHHCCSTPAIYENMVFIADCDGVVHCIDALTGQPLWTHKTSGEIWASPLVADGKLYIGNRRRDLCIFAAEREKKILFSLELDGEITSTPVAANGVLYLATAEKLYALCNSAKSP